MHISNELPVALEPEIPLRGSKHRQKHTGGNQVMISKTPTLKQTIRPWLREYPWDWFVTLSFGNERHNAYQCFRDFDRWMARLHKTHSSSMPFHFVISEFSSRFHLHALVGGVSQIPCRRARDEWHSTAHVEPYDHRRNGISYITKRIGSHTAEFEVGGEWPS
jgi:hypothetical protein